MNNRRTAADIEAEIAALTANFEAAKFALKTTPAYDPQRAEWRYTCDTYQGRLSNLTEELRRARMREGEGRS